MSDIYVDTSATYNGDGTTAVQATSDGGTGAYNNLSDPLANASAGDTIWVRRLGSSISVSAGLSPTHDGTESSPIILTGWPFKRELTGKTVDSVPTGTDSLGFNNAQWQFVDSDLTEDDNYWLGAEVEFTSGSNNGLKRKVIWFDATDDKIYLDFPLPNDIASGDQYTITLETEGYDDRPQSGIDEGWDNDTNPRPVLDAGSGNFDLLSFSGDYYWHVLNFEIKNVGSADGAFYYPPLKVYNCLVHDCGYLSRITPADKYCHWRDVYGWGQRSGYALFRDIYGNNLFEDCHFQGGATNSRLIYRFSGDITFKNVTSGRVTEMQNVDIRLIPAYGGSIVGENVVLASTTKIEIDNTGGTPVKKQVLSLSGYNNEPDKYHQWGVPGEIYNADENGTIDPPSGATTYIKIKPNSACNSELPLEYEERRYQSSGSRTYTWKFYPVNMSLGATDLEVEAWYLDESSGTHRAYATANPSAYNDGGWHDLSITVNPGQAGTVYFKIKLKKYNTSGCYVALDPKVSVS